MTTMLAASAAVAVAAYVDAKLQLTRDLSTLRRQSWAEKKYADAGE
jgi:hypothetical protein